MNLEKTLLRQQTKLVERAHREYLMWCKDGKLYMEMERLLNDLKKPGLDKGERVKILAQINGKLDAMDAKRDARQRPIGDYKPDVPMDIRPHAARLQFFVRNTR